MRLKLDGLIAEILRDVDSEILRQHPRHCNLPKAQRVHLIISTLVSEGVARIDENGSYRPSRRLERLDGVKSHPVPLDFEDSMAPLAIATSVHDFSNELSAYAKSNLEKSAGLIVSLFSMISHGLIKYTGREDGRCSFLALPGFEDKASQFIAGS